jgi:hypothetical protein
MSSPKRSRSKSPHSRHRSRSRSPRRDRRSEKGRYRERDRDMDERRRSRDKDRDHDRRDERSRDRRDPERDYDRDKSYEDDCGDWDRRRMKENRHRESHHEDRPKSRHQDRHKSRYEDREDYQKSRHDSRRRHRSRSRNRRRHYKSQRTGAADGEPTNLPYYARQLRTSDLATFRPLFAHYLDVQKELDISTLDDLEMRSRWKRFLVKWNRGELADGWYMPETFKRASVAAESGGGVMGLDVGNLRQSSRDGKQEEESEDEEEDEYGPKLPGAVSSIAKPRGPDVPRLQDLELRREMNAEEKEARVEELRDARKVDRRLQKERLEELVPRADVGTRERKLEKKKEVNEKMRAFREPSPGGEVPEEDLIGDGEGGIADYKRMMAQEKQKVSERQQRREEVERARNAERDERIRAYKDKEEATREMLRQLAKRQFG